MFGQNWYNWKMYQLLQALEMSDFVLLDHLMTLDLIHAIKNFINSLQSKSSLFFCLWREPFI